MRRKWLTSWRTGITQDEKDKLVFRSPAVSKVTHRKSEFGNICSWKTGAAISVFVASGCGGKSHLQKHKEVEWNESNNNKPLLIYQCHISTWSVLPLQGWNLHYVIQLWQEKIGNNFLNSCRNEYPSSEDEGQPLHKVVFITELCIIIIQLITLSSTPPAPLFCWDSVTDVSNSVLTWLYITAGLQIQI